MKKSLTVKLPTPLSPESAKPGTLEVLLYNYNILLAVLQQGRTAFEASSRVSMGYLKLSYKRV